MPNHRDIAFFKIALLASLNFLRVTNTYGQVWETRDQWSPEWEDRYSAWVEKNLTVDFWEKPDTWYYGKKLDCADNVYSMRVIFSFQNHLPFVIQDPTRRKKAISNEMGRWDRLSSEEERTSKFLDYLFGMISTRSIPTDTFPVEVNRDWVRAGTVIVTEKSNHHSLTVSKVSPEGIPSLVYSSRPARSHLLARRYIPSAQFLFPTGKTAESHAGFMWFRQPDQVGKPVWTLANASKDQYVNISESNWRKSVQKRLAQKEESLEQVLERILEDICLSSTERVQAVAEALAWIKAHPDQTMSPAEYDSYSTPSRDGRLKSALIDLEDTWVKAAPDAREVISQKKSLLSQVAAVLGAGVGPQNPDGRLVADLLNPDPTRRFCTIEIKKNTFLTLEALRTRMLAGKLSFEPMDSFEKRWGIR